MPTSRAVRVQIVQLLILLGAALSVSAALGAGSASAIVTCNKVAAPNGSDSNAGTVANPYATPQKLANSLSSGQTGCLRAGAYTGTLPVGDPDPAFREVRMTVANTTLTSYPGERARVVGRIWVDAASATVSDLDLDGTNSKALPSPTTNASNVTLSGNDVTNHNQTICFSVGSYNGAPPQNVLITKNRIHNCGELPATNHHHGIYITDALYTSVTNNLIYDNADRGIQQYPNASHTTSSNNVIDGNGEGVIFGGDSSTSSSNNLVDHNAITNSNLRFNVESNWGTTPGTGNAANTNCLYASNPDDPGATWYNANGGVLPDSPPGSRGFTTSGNVIAGAAFSNPAIYADRPNKNFHILSGSACATPVGDPAAQNSRWESASSASASGQDAFYPDVEIGTNGTAAAVWRRFDGSKWRLQANVRQPGGDWGAVTDLSAAGQDAYEARVGVAGNGEVVAAWRRFDGTNWRVETRSRSAGAGGSWGSTSTLSAAGQDGLKPDLSVGDDGSAVASWTRYDGANDRTQAAIRTPAGAWGAAATISAAGQDASQPRAGMGGNGTAVVAWRRFDGTNWRSQASVRAPGGAFGAATDLSAAGADSYDLAVDVGKGNTAVAVWQRFDGANTRAQAASRPSGGSWTAATTLSAAGANADTPQVGVAADNSAVAVWRRSNGTKYVAQASGRTAAGVWGTASNLSDATQDSVYPQVGVGDDGAAVATWRRSDGTNDRVESVTRPAGGTFGSVSVLSNAATNSDSPQVSVGAKGRAFLVFQTTVGGKQQIFSSGFFF